MKNAWCFIVGSDYTNRRRNDGLWQKLSVQNFGIFGVWCKSEFYAPKFYLDLCDIKVLHYECVVRRALAVYLLEFKTVAVTACCIMITTHIQGKLEKVSEFVKSWKSQGKCYF